MSTPQQPKSPQPKSPQPPPQPLQPQAKPPTATGAAPKQAPAQSRSQPQPQPQPAQPAQPQPPQQTPPELVKLQNELKKAQERAAGAHGRGAQLDELAADVLFLSLLSRTLLQILLDTRLTTVEYVIARMRQLDMLDGVPDGGLPAQIIAQELGMRKPEVDRKKAFSDALKKTRSSRVKKTR